MSNLLGQYTINAVNDSTYDAWLEQLYSLAAAGWGMKQMQDTTFKYFKKYFIERHPNDRLLAIRNDARLKDRRGQAMFLYAHRPLTGEEKTTRGWALYCNLPEYDPQWIMVDEGLITNKYLDPSPRMLPYTVN